MLESRFTEDQIAMAKACGSPEELQLLISSEGVELTDEELGAISGGYDRKEQTTKNYKYVCKSCGGDVQYRGPQKRYVCLNCGRDKMYPSDMGHVEV